MREERHEKTREIYRRIREWIKEEKVPKMGKEIKFEGVDMNNKGCYCEECNREYEEIRKYFKKGK
jgi:DNA polymerase I-like protein with 3'-5' exonuclease and polymerase domains